jgi:DUF917 family protein
MIISPEQLPYLARGAAVLGSGGGQNPEVLLKSVEMAMQGSTGVLLVDVDTLDDEALVVPVEYMGAPDPSAPLVLDGRDVEQLIKRVELRFGKKVDAILSGEIGGANGLVGVLIAARLGLPLIDGDNVGRALPMLQMNTPSLFGIKPTPAFLSGKGGETIVEIDSPDVQTLETISRALAISLGGNAAFIYNVMHGFEAKKAIAKNTLSQAIRLGRQNFEGKPIGTMLGQGKITRIELERKSGFLRGEIEISGMGPTLHIDVCNEFMALKREGRVLSCAPEIIVMVANDRTIITSDSAKLGMFVVLSCLKAPEIWLQKAGLKVLEQAGFRKLDAQ